MRRIAAILAAPALLLAVLVPMALASHPRWSTRARRGHRLAAGRRIPATAGTTGQSRQMEALRISGGTLAGDIEYRAHVANIGWMAWVGPAFTAGRLAKPGNWRPCRVRLSGASALAYSVECRAHVANIGWLPWVRDGATCGTTGRDAGPSGAAAARRTTPTATPTATSTPSTTPTLISR